MKNRNNCSKAFHANSSKMSDTNSHLLKKEKSFCELAAIIKKVDCGQKEQISRVNAFKQIIQRCYNDKLGQQQCCQALSCPFLPGPVHLSYTQMALNSIPKTFFLQQYLTNQDPQTTVANQITNLFQYLKKVKEYFYCWIIHYSHELKILTVKIIKKYEFKENLPLLNSKQSLIGIIVDREHQICIKKSSKQLCPKGNSKLIKKFTAFSCYNHSNIVQFQNQSNPRNPEKTLNTASVYSVKSIKSASKTSSSFFKPETNKLCLLQSNNPSQILFQQKQIHPHNLKKKKQKITMLAEPEPTKINQNLINGLRTSKKKKIKNQHRINFQLTDQTNNFRNQQEKNIFTKTVTIQKSTKNSKNKPKLSDQPEVQNHERKFKMPQNLM